jgi:universal stress protein E
VHPCIEKAARLAESFGSTLDLYICDVEQEVPDNLAGGTTLAQYRAMARERRIALLEKLAEPLRARGLFVRTDSNWHFPLEAGVVQHAIKSDADLVVKDTHRHPVVPHLSGAETDWVLIRHLPMPLLLVRPTPWSEAPTIAVSVDPGHVAERPAQLDSSLVSLGRSIGQAVSGQLQIVHALEGPAHLPGEPVSADKRRHALDQQRAAVHEIARCAHVADNAVRFAERSIPDGIVDLVREAHPAILVMGVAARQRYPGSAASTASQVLEQTDCDLLVLKPLGFVSPALVRDSPAGRS